MAKKQIIPSKIPRRIKNRANKANPKIDDKEQAPSKAVDKEWTPPFPPSSSSSKTTHDAPISPQRMHLLSIEQHPLLAIINLKKFKSTQKMKVPLTDDQRFPLAFILGNP